MGLPKQEYDRGRLRAHHDSWGHFGVDPTLNKRRNGRSLRSQLLDRVAILLTLALLTLAVVMLVWLPRAPSPQVLLVSLLSLIAVDTAVVLAYGDYRLRRLVVRPVAAMVEQAEAIAVGKYDQRLERSGAEELKRLAESVNAMADRLIHNQEQLSSNVRSLHATNRELVLARQELLRAEKLAAVGRMAAGVAHEIGNPLGGLMGYLEVARRRGSGDTEWIDAVEGEARRIDGVVRGMLDFARPQNARVTDFDVNAIVRETVHLLQNQGRLKTVRIETDLELPGATVRGDSQHFEQIMVNLLLNADDAIREAVAPGRITVVTTLKQLEGEGDTGRLRRDGDPEGIDYSHLRPQHLDDGPLARFEPGDRVVHIEVSDNGIGISEEELEHVFEPFFTTKDPGRGTGLGLAVCARLATEFGGTMTAESKPNDGTRFGLILPCATGQSQSARIEGVA